MMITPKTSEALLKKYKVKFFPKIEEDVKVQGLDAAFERYTQHLPGKFMPLGSYSYAQSYFGDIATIGRYCSIGKNVKVMGDAHPLEWMSTSPFFYRKKRARFGGSKRTEFPDFEAKGAPVVIENDVWVGDNVTLAHGVRLETGCVVASGATVTKNVPPYAIVGGVPAKVIRKRFDEATIARLLETQWWRYPIFAWDDYDMTSPNTLINCIADVRRTYDELPEKRATIETLHKEVTQDP